VGITIIIKDSVPKGNNRTRTDRLLGEKWGTTSFRNEEDADKAKFLERKIKKYHGSDDSRVTAKLINQVE
jgi:hypothetical protein